MLTPERIEVLGRAQRVVGSVEVVVLDDRVQLCARSFGHAVCLLLTRPDARELAPILDRAAHTAGQKRKEAKG